MKIIRLFLENCGRLFREWTDTRDRADLQIRQWFS